jgi:hypothetical protein
MSTGRELEMMLLQSPGERPPRGIARNLMYGSVAALILTLFRFLAGALNWRNAVGFLLIGNGVSFFGWGAERLWYATVSTMVENPFSISAYCSRIPFWYIAGGIGYTLAALMAKKLGLLDVTDIPVKGLFDVGGRIECVIQVPLQILLYRKLMSQSLAKKIFELTQ